MEQSAKNSQGGNTNTPCKKNRCYILTIFNDELKHFDKAIYECWCDDTCKDGKPHKHQVIYFKNPISFKTIKKSYPTAHIEFAHNVEDAIHYILDNKNGRKNNIEELGKRPHKHTFEKMSDLKDEDSDDIPPFLYSAYSKYKNKPRPIKTSEWMKKVKVYYISGPSGIGKSTKAYDLLVENGIEEFDEISYDNGFYIGCSGAKACVFDDFRDSRMKPDEFIRFIDYRRHTMNIKGGQVLNNYELIIITSIKSLNAIYSNVSYGEQKQQWLRRIEHIQLIDKDALP